METRLLVLCAVCATALQAQSIAVVAPSTGQTLSGWSGSSLAVSISSAPNVSMVCYTVDAHPATNPGPVGVISGSSGAFLAAGCSNTPPYSLPINTFWWLNGSSHQVVATAYDAAGAVVATSSPVNFGIQNSWPVTCTPVFTVTTGTPATSNWSGQVSVTGTMTGACASDNLSFHFYVDGIAFKQINNITTGSQSATVDTTDWLNGPHNVAVMVFDSTNKTTYSYPGSVSGAAEWSRTVNFSNSATPAEVWSSARDIYITPTGAGSTYTASCTLVNTDSTTVGSPTCYWVSNNPSLATVGGGQYAGGASVTVAGANGGNGSTQLQVMGVSNSGTDGKVANSQLWSFSSVSYTPRSADVGKLLQITGGTNCIVGIYYIGNLESTWYDLADPTNTSNSKNFATSTSATCNWSLGPTRTFYAEINSTNPPIPCFQNSGPILTGGAGYPSNCIVMSEGFLSSAELTSQPYPVPYLTNFCNSGFNTLENSPNANTASTQTGTAAAFITSEASYISNLNLQLTGGCSKLGWFGITDNLSRTSPDLYAASAGSVSYPTWSPSMVTTIFSSLIASTYPWRGVSWEDEGTSSWGIHPLQGPIQPSVSGTIQNWLTSITASSGTCTALTTTTTPGGIYNINQNNFTISSSATTNMNSGSGTHYTATAVDGTHFIFACASVANGTYDHTTDPGLTIQALNAGVWTGSNFVNYDAWASMVNQANAAGSNRTPVAMSVAGVNNKGAVAGWTDTTGQSLVYGGNTITSAGDWSDFFWSHGGTESYLPSREGLNSLIADNATAAAGPEEGYWLRTTYGSYNPAKAFTTISQGTSALYGLDSIPSSTPTVVSCRGNNITFSAAHNITNIVPGLSRLTVSGSTDANCNTNLVILSVPTATTVTVAYAATQTVCTGACGSSNGGTIHWQDGTTTALNFITADGQAQPMGKGSTQFEYTGSPTDAVNRHRCQTFTLTGVAGTAATYFNSTTFIYDCENLIHATDGNGSSVNYANYFREIPVLSGTGGTADIIADNEMVRGRTPSDDGTNAGDSDPDFAFLSVVEAMIAGASGHRMYKVQANPQAYVDHAITNPFLINGGWTGSGSEGGSLISTYNQTATSGLENQLYSHPNVENGYSVPEFWALSTASLIWERLAALDFGTKLNSPDYGPRLDCGARSGTYGDLMVCGNFSNGPETRAYSLSAYETAGQNIVRYRAMYTGIEAIAVIAAGTPTDTVTLGPGEAVFYAFPAAFASWLQQAAIAVRLADVTGATDIVLRFGYDFYNLDSANVSYDCGGSGLCVPPVDSQIGPVYYRIIYRNSSGVVLATSDIQKL